MFFQIGMTLFLMWNPTKLKKKETSHTIHNIFFCVQQKTESHTGLERHEGVYINLFLGDLFKDNLFYINSQQVIFLSFYICLFSCLAFPIVQPLGTKTLPVKAQTQSLLCDITVFSLLLSHPAY